MRYDRHDYRLHEREHQAIRNGSLAALQLRQRVRAQAAASVLAPSPFEPVAKALGAIGLAVGLVAVCFAPMFI